MKQITYIDPDNARGEHSDVVRYLEACAREHPETSFKVFVNRKFNPMEPLEWSVILTSPKGRRHLNVDQRKPGGSIQISSD